MFIKVTHNSNTRKLKLADGASLSVLQAELVRAFGEKVSELSIGYLDSDSELITVANEEDWKVCLEEFAEKNKGKPFVTVNIQLSADEFVNVAASAVSVKDESAVEIKEEPVQTKVAETLPEGKTIVEVPQPSVFEMDEPAPKPAEPTPAPKAPETPEVNVGNLVQNLSNALESMFGIKVESVDAHIEHPAEESADLNESSNSTLTHEQKEEIDTLIEQKLSKMLNLKKTEQPKVVSPTEFVHRGITCDGCQKNIINCARFKSLVRPDYDLCEACEKKGLHPEPMVRFATPAAQNPWQLERKFRELFPLFTQNAPQQPECEGFRFPRRHPWGGPRPEGGCPFKRGPFGGTRGHCPAFGNQNSEHPLAGLLKGGDISGLIGMVPEFLKNGFLGNLAKECSTKPSEAPKKETPKTEKKPEVVPTPTAVDADFDKLMKDLIELAPQVDRAVLEEVVKTNGFKSAQEAYNFLFN